MAQKFTVPVTIKNLSSAGSDGITVFLDQESFARLKVEAGGRITWGAGAGAGDTNLYRDEPNVLKTDDTFKSAGLFVAGTQIDPSAATVGDALVFNGTKFVSASVAGGGGGGGASLTVSDTAPTSPSVGDLWFNSSNARTYVYYDSSWVEVGGSGGVAGLDDIGNVSASTPSNGDFLKWNGTAWVNDPINLGTDTTGNYMSDLTQGTGVTITHTPGEGSNATIAIGQAVGTSASVTFASVTAPLIGNVTGNVTGSSGSTTGNAATATALQNARTISLGGDLSGSASFNGTSDITISASVVNSAVSLNEISDVVITSPEEFQSLVYDGTNFVNQYASVVTYVRNAEATTLTTGTAVYLFGATGDHASVKRADNDSDTTSSKTVGLVAANIAAAENGPVVTRGYVDGIDLSVGYTPGDILWLGEDGAFTTTKPSAPEHLVFIGVVVRATNNGIVYVATQNGYELDELHDVKINGVTDGQFLRYNSASTVWVNDTINLGTDTAGDYVQSLVAGTGVTLTNNSGESATPTVAIGQSVATSASVTFAHLIVQGDMEVQGTITRLNETNLDVESAFIYLNANSASANPDMGIAFNYDDGTYRHAGLFRDSSDGIFKVFEGYEPEPVSPINTSDATYSDARFQADSIILTQTTGTAPMSVSSSTVVTNFNADKLDGQDGSYYAPIDSPTFTGTVSLPNNTVALGTQTTGNYMSDVSAGTGISVSHTPGEGSSATVSLNATLDDLSNVTATSPADGNFLKYVSASSSWVPATIPTINALDDIGNVTVPSPNTNDVLTYNGSVWTSASASGGSTVTASTTPPSSPEPGSIWFDSSSAKTYVYYDSFWVEIGGTSGGAKMYVDQTAPTSPLEGQLWFKSDTAQTFAYYDSFWVEVGAAGMSAIAADSAPASPVTGQLWFNSSTGGTYVYYDSSWIEVGAHTSNTVLNLVEAKGDILVGTADNVLDRQAVGTNGQLLQVNSATTSGLEWFTPTYAPSASPTFTGVVTIPAGASISGYATLAGPTFTGTVVLPSTTSIGTVSATELGYLDGVTSAIQTQLNTKASTGKAIAMAIVFGG